VAEPKEVRDWFSPFIFTPNELRRQYGKKEKCLSLRDPLVSEFGLFAHKKQGSPLLAPRTEALLIGVDQNNKIVRLSRTHLVSKNDSDALRLEG